MWMIRYRRDTGEIQSVSSEPLPDLDTLGVRNTLADVPFASVEWRSHADVRATVTPEGVVRVEFPGIQALRESGATEELSWLRDQLAALDQLLRPLFETPDAPRGKAWEWRNLWAFWQFVPGTARPRSLLTLWTFKDWWIIGGAMFVLGSALPWRGTTALGVLGMLSVAGFFVHELFFRWWGTQVCRLKEVDPGEYETQFTPTFERFVSRYMA